MEHMIKAARNNFHLSFRLEEQKDNRSSNQLLSAAVRRLSKTCFAQPSSVHENQNKTTYINHQGALSGVVCRSTRSWCLNGPDPSSDESLSSSREDEPISPS